MSDKYIPYGPGKDIDPDKIEAQIKKGDGPIESIKIFRALQQREENSKNAQDEIQLAYQDIKDRNFENALKRMIAAYQILEGSDGK